MKLDFNALEQPTLELTLKDDNKTTIHATAPTEELVERLTAAAPDLKKTIDQGHVETTKALYGLMADLMSCNREGITFTAESLRDTYRLRLFELVVFVKTYLEFIGEISGAKN